MKRQALLLLCLAAAPPAATPLLAATDAEQARRLAEQGEIMQLEVLIEQVRKEQPGRIIEMELERRRGAWVYELELVDPDGQVWELEYDAATGRLLDREMEDDD